MKDIDTVPYHPTAEKLVDILCKRTQNTNKIFFRVLVAYYFAKVASMMRAYVQTHDRGRVPINLYAINLGSSGIGKGHSSGIIEDEVIHVFREEFLEKTFLASANKNIAKLAVKRSIKKDSDPDDELKATHKEFDNMGELAFSFDSGTTAAVKQMRHKLLMADAGSMNMEIDEIGSNLLGNVEVLNTFLELFDMGKVKQKLTKNTSENTRSEEIYGRTPTNMLLFGTPSKLFNGGKVEEEILAMFETGFARRCFFGIDAALDKNTDLTPKQIYDMLTDKSTEAYLHKISNDLGQLADASNFDVSLKMTEATSLLLIEYKIWCEKRANKMPEHDDIRKAEMGHRYFKSLKLAGTYAFIDGSDYVTDAHLYNAFKLAEESGKAFSKMLTRDRNYVKLAKYIASIQRRVTHVDLVEDLPFYKGGEAAKREMMTLATAWGYKHNIIIKRIFENSIEFMEGESLEITDINKLIVSHGPGYADGYSNELAPFSQLSGMTQLPDYNWTNHHVLDGKRSEDTVMQGFNLLVLDVDSVVPLETAKLLLKNYSYLMHTTKRHTDAQHRFRIVLPLSHRLKLNKEDYTEFMTNLYAWLPFEVDTSTIDRSRKWATHDGKYFQNTGELVDALLFIPKTTKSEAYGKFVTDHRSLTNMERWFVNNTGTGNRSNQLVKYALLLVDAGMPFDGVSNAVKAFNDKLQDKLPETELMTTILKTALKAIAKRDGA